MNYRKGLFFIILIITVCISKSSFSQGTPAVKIDYSAPKKYVIGGITVSGVKYLLDPNVIINLSGLSVGDTILIPGEEISTAIKKLWENGLFSDIQINAERAIGSQIFLDIHLAERPRLSKFSFAGIRKGEAEDIREKLKLRRGMQVTEHLILRSKSTIKRHFIDKGFLNVDVNAIMKDDTTLPNYVILNIKINKKKKIKINEIIFDSVTVFNDGKLRRSMKNTKKKRWYNIFKTSKFIRKDYKEDKKKIIAVYNKNGYRDAKIIRDTVYPVDEKTINIEMEINEGSKYYFRNISWIGNTKYSSKVLNKILGLKKGDVYNQEALDNKLFIDPNGVSSKYLDNGYLFFSVTPVEVQIENDSIDLELRIYEGEQARINRIIISGNTSTNEHVFRRELYTRPGDLFSRNDIIRSQRELSQLPYVNPEKLDVRPIPDPASGTVDIEYVLEEKPASQVELSGGFGAGMIIGTFGLSFNNFSLRNVLKPKAYRPLPSGDGQRLSLRAQSNGTWYQSYNMSFVEPWLGGKKPNSFSLSAYHTVQSSGAQPKKTEDEAGNKIKNPDREFMKITGVAVGYGKRLPWPDDYFSLMFETSYRNYNLNNFSGGYYYSLPIDDGNSNNLSFKGSLNRNSIDAPIYPRRGSMFNLSVQATPPYSFFNDKDYATIPNEEKYKWIEYIKPKFTADWYLNFGNSSRFAKNLVLHPKAEFGILFPWTKDLISPFEGFSVGGDGWAMINYGTEIIGLRGYDNGTLTPDEGGNVYNKFALELRYPLSLNPAATFYLIGFVEGGNAWYEHRNYNPFDIKRSAGIGVRIFLPMFGMLGVDYGYGFDTVYDSKGFDKGVNKGQFHFMIGQQF